jgi:hypothetical protein
MKGFPNITRANDFIVARYDNTLVDAKPWLRGQTTCGAEWVNGAMPLDNALNLVEGRHPLAAAHYINHPAPSGKSNVYLAPFDLTLSEGTASACLRLAVPREHVARVYRAQTISRLVAGVVLAPASGIESKPLKEGLKP